MKDKIKSKEPLHFWVRGYNVQQPHLLRADEVEFINNHLMFRLKGELMFKVWLRRTDYKNVKEALQDVGIEMR